MARRLPPLKTLEGFDAAARLGSFAAAAEELGLTQSAISHQVRLLESMLDQTLFRRLHRKVVLTDAGRDFHRTVRQMFRGLHEGMRKLEPYRKDNTVIVYSPPDLANGWLVHKLAALREALPDVDVWLDSTGFDVDFSKNEVDILIKRLGHVDGTLDAKPDMILPFDYRPVAAPALASRLQKAIREEQFTDIPLLHFEAPVGWPEWIESGIGRMDEARSRQLSKGTNFSDAYTVLRYAVKGMGAALPPTVVASNLVKAGSLTWLHSHKVRGGGYGFWLDRESRAEKRIDVNRGRVFEWLRDHLYSD